MLHMSGNDTILVKYYYYTIFKLSNNVLSLKQYKRICWKRFWRYKSITITNKCSTSYCILIIFKIQSHKNIIV